MNECASRYLRKNTELRKRRVQKNKLDFTAFLAALIESKRLFGFLLLLYDNSEIILSPR